MALCPDLFVGGHRDSLPTPALVIDRDVVRSNLSAMRRLLDGTGVAHRPHFKAHKCLEIGRLQLESGADGFCAATVGEAEVLSVLDTSVLLTSVVSSGTNIGRVVELRANGCDLTLVVDSAVTAQRLSDALVGRGCAADVLIDVDTGRGRSGCASVEQAVQLARQIQQLPGLILAGLQLYAGHLSHRRDPSERERAHADFRDQVTRFREALADLLPAAPIVTGGSTGSILLDLHAPVLSEVQCGSYVLMDVEYLAMPFSADVTWPFGAAISVQASILSSNWDGHAIADAGDQRFASKYGHDPRLTRVPAGIELADASYRPVSDEHGRLDFPPGHRPPPVGARVECVVPHLDPSINLFDTAYVVSGDTVVDAWAIDARGA